MQKKEYVIALVGNPNTGKSTLFNALTGLRQHVGNYPGVTVEKKEGSFRIEHHVFRVYDLPGTYALNPKSMDERITYEVLLGARSNEPTPDVIVAVVDASNLERNLYLVTQIADLGFPCIVALNMTDAAASKGISVNAGELSRILNVPVIPMVASKGLGIDLLKQEIDALSDNREQSVARVFNDDDVVFLAAEVIIRKWIRPYAPIGMHAEYTEAFRLLNNLGIISEFSDHPDQNTLRDVLAEARSLITQSGGNSTTAEILARYSWIGKQIPNVVIRSSASNSLSERIDRVVTHKIWGPLIFVGILLVMFQSIFTWAEPFMDLIDTFFIGLGGYVASVLPDSWYSDLLTEGVIAGLGGVVIFLPQIMILFFFISILEGTGYMARAAFVMDGFMTRIGLNGRSVAPLISGFACAIPGIMATRTIENNKDRLITIMVLPFMACSARLPVYALMTVAFVPDTVVFGIFDWQGITFFGLYFFGIATAVTAAWVFKKVYKGEQSIPFLMELPDYKMPAWRGVIRTMLQRGWIFVWEAGKVIMVISIVLWFAATYPKNDQMVSLESEPNVAEEVISGGEERASGAETIEASEQLRNSYAGRFGRMIEPAIEPLGFDWKIGISLLTSFAAREVVVGTLNTIYSVESEDDDIVTLKQKLIEDRDPVTGEQIYGFWTAISLMVFFALACQCMSTLAIVKRETQSWKWPVVMFTYMTALAWIASFIVFQAGSYFFPHL